MPKADAASKIYVSPHINHYEPEIADLHMKVLQQFLIQQTVRRIEERDRKKGKLGGQGDDAEDDLSKTKKGKGRENLAALPEMEVFLEKNAPFPMPCFSVRASCFCSLIIAA